MRTLNPVFYSQNFEDVLLARCFSGLEVGFYIDVGAQNEKADSVTRYFYERGWCGINIEPVKEFADTFQGRERDITICCAAGAQEQILTMDVSLETGLSSFCKANTLEAKHRGFTHEAREIIVRRLDSILLDLGFTEKSFEFLKIDVEGFELEVIKGIDLNRYRPKVILCEVTTPNTAIKTADFPIICNAIESHGYRKTLFDGLNQWWVACECSDELEKSFELPPSVHDSGFITPYASTFVREHLEVNARERDQAILERDQLKNGLNAIYASRIGRFLTSLRMFRSSLFS